MAKLPRMFKTKSMTKAVWDKVSLEDAVESYGLESLGIEADEILPDDPENAWVCQGDVRVDGPLEITGAPDYEDVALFVINGNLDVDGPLLFNQDDFHSALFVTGDLRCKNAFIEAEAALLVGKTLHAGDLLYTHISDAGHLLAGGLAAKYWLNEHFRGAIYVRSEPKTTMLRGGDHKYLLDQDEESIDEDDPQWSFRAKDARSVFDVLDPKLIEEGEGAAKEKLRRAMSKGTPLFKVAP